MRIQGQQKPDFNAETCFIVGVFSDHTLTPVGQMIDQQSQNGIAGLLKDQGLISGLMQKIGQVLYLPILPFFCGKVLLVNCGNSQIDLNADDYHLILDSIGLALQTIQTKYIYIELSLLAIKHQTTGLTIFHTVQRLGQCFYQFDVFKAQKNFIPEILFIACPERHLIDLARANAFLAGLKKVKDWANLPSNICHPAYLAQEAEKIAALFPDCVKVNVLDQADIQKINMNALLAVAAGSNHPPKFICLHYQSRPSEQAVQKPIVLIGKGVTFDSGGISLKAPIHMDEMKYDMCGAATVMGLIHIAASLKLPLHIISLIPAVENMPSHQATRPGDIVTSLSGKTIEILNTDAEGRLILCDALTYAERFSPDIVIDIATLTGGALMTFGHISHAMMGNDQALMNQLLQLGEMYHDRLWQLPLWQEYQDLLHSNFADIPNIHDDLYAKTIVGGCFLSRFAERYRWVHLDIAGTAWLSGKAKGATGRPLLLLFAYLLARSGVMY